MRRGLIDVIKGWIFNIQKFAIYDGPGIRTLVFFKGCPLKCIWCQNPEGLIPYPQLSYYDRLCIHCHTCIDICPNNVIRHSAEDVHIIDRDLCNICGKCVELCPSGALNIIGKEVTVEDLVKEIQKDVIYFDSSDGGVTFSGGEPLFQPRFLYESLKKCKELGIHTAVETSGYASSEVFKQISNYVDLFLYDIKIIDEHSHVMYTGVSNKQILSNLRFLASTGRGKDVIIRVPLIPTITDTDKNIEEIINLLSSLNCIEEVHLLPFHDVYEKYKNLGVPYKMHIHKPPSIEKIKSIKKRFEERGFTVSLWGIK